MSDRAAAETDEAMVSLARAVAADPSLANVEWSELSLVIGRTATAPTIESIGGYRYQTDGEWAAIDIDFDLVAAPFQKIIAAMAEHEAAIGNGWVKCLFQLQQSSGDSKFQYEWHEQNRWEPNLSDSGELPEEIRPVFKAKPTNNVAPRRLPPGSLT